jgi:hypothetical protein
MGKWEKGYQTSFAIVDKLQLFNLKLLNYVTCFGCIYMTGALLYNLMVNNRYHPNVWGMIMFAFAIQMLVFSIWSIQEIIALHSIKYYEAEKLKEHFAKK